MSKGKKVGSMGEQYAHVHLSRWGELSWLPYQALIGMLMIISGLSKILPSGEPIMPLSPYWLSAIAGVIYLFGGSCILVGMWRSNIPIEVVGHVLLVMGVLVVTSVGFLYEGPDIFSDFLIFISVAFAAGTRLYQLARGRTVIQVEVDAI